MRIWQEDAKFSMRKLGRFSHLVHYGTPTRFHAYVYGMHQCAQTKICQGSPKYETHDTCCIHGETDVSG